MLKKRALPFMSVAGILASGLFFAGCGKNLDDPKTFVEENIENVVLSKSVNWYPKNKKPDLKITFSEEPTVNPGGLGYENISFSGTVELPETSYLVLDVLEETGTEKSDYKTAEEFKRMLRDANAVLVQVVEKGTPIDVNGVCYRARMNKDADWEFQGAHLFSETLSPLCESEFRDEYGSSRVLKKGTPEFDAFLAELKSTYEAAQEAKKKAIEEEKKKQEELNSECARLQNEINALKADLQKSVSSARALQRDQDQAQRNIQTLKTRIARDEQRLQTARPQQIERFKQGIDAAKKEITALEARCSELAKEIEAASAKAKEKEEAMKPLQEELNAKSAELKKYRTSWF